VKKIFISLMLLAASFAVTGTASAIVLTGSTYSVYLEGETSGNASLPVSVFDDTPATFTRAGLLVTTSESDTMLSNVNNRISLNLSADGDLFPVFNEGAYLGVGTFGDVIDLVSEVTLYDVRVTLRDLVGKVLFVSDNLIDSDPTIQTQPWDGSLPTPATSLFISEIGGQGLSNITFDFYVRREVHSDVPEPGSMLLCGAGLLAACIVRRRRQSRM